MSAGSSSGSGKKGKNLPVWFTCSKCNKRYIRQISSKHLDSNCAPVYPYIEDSILKSMISFVPPKSDVQKLHFMGTKKASNMILMSKELIRECGLTSLCWVKVHSSDSSGKPDPGVYLQVWPLVGESIQTILMTKEGLSINYLDSTKVYSIQMISDFTNIIFPLAEITIQVDKSEDDDVIQDLQEFRYNFKRIFMNRILSPGQKFKMKQFLFDIPISVDYLKYDCDLSCLEDKFSSINIRRCDDEANVLQLDFGEITQETQVLVKKERDMGSKDKLDNSTKYELDDLGGIESVIKEITSSIGFTLTNCLSGSTNISRGIIIYGNPGVGKSHLIRAICSSFNLVQFNYNPSSDNQGQTMRNIFSQAIQKSPSVIIFENLDTLSTAKSQNFNFNTTFRLEVEKLLEEYKSKQVILLASCNEIDLVNSSIRSPHLFAKEVEIPVPSKIQRKDILIKLLEKRNHTLSSDEIEKISSETHGFVGADLVSLLSRASTKAFERSQSKMTFQECEESLKFVRPSAIRSMIVDVPNVKWEDIGGQIELKFILKQAIEWPLKHPESFLRLGVSPPKGVLLYGPPGTGKTMIAKAIATESGLNFLSVKGSELFSKWVGESEKAVRTIFRKARQVAPCIIFFDEIDSLGGERGQTSGSSNVHERVLAQLLIEMDGIEPLKEVTIVGATNRPDIIDQALLRPGRLDKIIYVPLPDAKTREDIFKIRFRKMPVDSSLNIEVLVAKTDGYSSAEIVGVCQEAAMKALEEDINSKLVKLSHFLSALKIISPRITRDQIQFYENYKNQRQAKY